MAFSLFFDGKSEERKRITEAIVTAPLPTVKKNPDNDEQQKKRRRKRKRKKYGGFILSRKKLLIKQLSFLIAALCKWCQTFFTFSPCTYMITNVCSIPFDDLNGNKQA